MRRREYKLLCDAFPNYQYGEGIFAAIKEVYDNDVPEYLEDDELLDIDYFAVYSGGKRPSPIVFDDMLGNDGGRLLFRVDGGGRFLTVMRNRMFVKSMGDDTALDHDQRLRLARLIVNRYGDKWSRLYQTLIEDYNPLENYNMTEEETPELTDTTSIASKVTTSGNSSTDASVYAFNTSGTSGVPQASSDASGSSTVEGLAKDNITTTSRTGSRSLTRSGNIGVTTSQQMAQSEIELRQYNFREQMYKDVDEVLTLPTW